jgi:hypothetical protein
MLKATVTLGIGPAGIGTKTMLDFLAQLAKNHCSRFADRGEIISHHIAEKTEFGLRLKRHQQNPAQIPSELILTATLAWVLEQEAVLGTQNFFLAGFPMKLDEATMWRYVAPRVRVITLVPDDNHETPHLTPFNGHVLRLSRSQPIRERLEAAIEHVNAPAETRFRWQAHLKDHKHPVRQAIKKMGN